MEYPNKLIVAGLTAAEIKQPAIGIRSTICNESVNLLAVDAKYAFEKTFSEHLLNKWKVLYSLSSIFNILAIYFIISTSKPIITGISTKGIGIMPDIDAIPEEIFNFLSILELIFSKKSSWDEQFF